MQPPFHKISWCLLIFATAAATLAGLLPAADISADEPGFDDLASSSSHTSASMEPVNTTASASSSSGSSSNHSPAAAGAGGGNGVFGGLFGFNMPGGNGRVQHKVGDEGPHARAANAVVAAAAAMAAAADARRPPGSGGFGGPTGGS